MKMFGTISAATLLCLVVNAEVFTLGVLLFLALVGGCKAVAAVIAAQDGGRGNAED